MAREVKLFHNGLQKRIAEQKLHERYIEIAKEMTEQEFDIELNGVSTKEIISSIDVTDKRRNAIIKSFQTYKKVAPLFTDKIDNFISMSGAEGFNIFQNTAKFSKLNTGYDPINYEKVYTEKLNLKSDFFEDLGKKIQEFGTNKKQTPGELIKQVQLFDKVNYYHNNIRATRSIEQMKRSYEFLKKAEKVMIFDFETLGGNTFEGAKRIHGLTEVAYSLRGKDRLNDIENFSFLVGISEEKYKELSNKIEMARKTGSFSNETNILIRRLGLYGHKDTVISQHNNGLKYVEKLADVDKNYHFSDEEIRKGLKVLRETRIHHEGIITKNGLNIEQEAMANFLSILNNNEIAKAGHNIENADLNWTQTLLANSDKFFGLTEKQNKAFAQIANLPIVNGEYQFAINSNKDAFFDSINYSRMAMQKVGSEKYYVGENAQKILKEGTASAQETLGKVFADTHGTAHNALSDVLTNADLLFKPQKQFNGKTLIEQMWEDSKFETYKNHRNMNLNGQTLVYVDNAERYGSRNPIQINAVYDPFNKQYRMANKINLNDNGAERDIISEVQLKRNRLYTIDAAGKLDMQSKWAKNLYGVHDDIATNQLYFIKYSPYSNKNVGKGNQSLQGYTMRFFTSEEEMLAELDSLNILATRKDKRSKFNPIEGALERFTEYDIKDGILQEVGTKDFEGIVKELTERDLNDSAVRSIRDNNWKKAKAYYELYTDLKNKNGGNEVSSEQYRTSLVQMLQRNDRNLSADVAKGKALPMNFEQVKDILGYVDYTTKQTKLMSNTIDNATTSFEYMKSMIPTIQAINNFFIENNITNEKQQAYYYSNIIDSIVEQASIEMQKNGAEKAWLNSAPQTVFKKDLDYFVFNMQDFMPRSKIAKISNYVNKPSVEEELLRVDLREGKYYSLGNQLLKMFKPNLQTNNLYEKNNHMVSEMISFIQNVNDSKQYEGMFQDVDNYMKYTSPDSLAHKIIEDIKAYRKIPKNATKGFQEKITAGNVLNYSKTFEHINKKGDIETRIKNVAKEIAPLKIFDSISSTNELDKLSSIVTEALVDKIDPLEFAKKAGWEGDQARHISNLYNKAKQEYNSFIKEMIGEFTKIDGVNFGYNPDKKQFMFLHNGGATYLDLPQIRAKENNLYIDMMNGQKIALFSYLDAGNMLKIKRGKNLIDNEFDLNQLSIITSLGRSINETISPHSVAETAQRQGNIANHIESLIMNFKRNIREKPAINNNDILDRSRNLHINIEDLFGVTQLYLNKYKTFGDTLIRDEDLFDIIFNRDNYRPNFLYGSTNSAEREIMQKNIPFILQKFALLKGQKNENDEWNYLIANNLSNRIKETMISEGIMSVGNPAHLPGEQLTNAGRPVVDQGKSIIYPMSILNKLTEEEKDKIGMVSQQVALTNNWYNQNKNLYVEGVGETYESIIATKANISELDLRLGIAERYAKHRSKKDEYVYNRLKSMSLTEQEQIVNARLIDTVFERSEIKKISANKKLADYHNLTAESIKEFNKIMPTFKVDKNGHINFSYKQGVYKKAGEDLLHLESFVSGDYAQVFNKDGLLKFGYFANTGNGLLISEAQIIKELEQQNIKTKEKAEAYLRNKYEAAWYLDPIDLSNYKKFHLNNQEKGMSYAYLTGLGEVDDVVSSYFEKFAETKKGKKIGDIRNHVLRTSAIDWLMSDEMFDTNIAKELGINSQDLKQRIMKERYTIQDEIDKIIGFSAGIIANQAQDKHKNELLKLNELILTLQAYQMDKNGLSQEDAMKLVVEQLFNEDIIHFSNAKFDAHNSLIISNNLEYGKDYINNTQEVLDNFLEKYYPDFRKYQDIYIDINNGEKRLLGKKSVTILSEVASYQGISGRTPEEYNKIIEDLEKKINSSSGVERQNLIKKRDNIQRAIDFQTKGQKITQREMFQLNFQKYDDDFVERTLGQLNNDTELFEKTYGHILKKENGKFLKINGRYLMKEEYQGQSMLKSYSDELMKQFLTGGKSEILTKNTEYAALYKDESVQTSIKNIVEEAGGKLSKDRAEQFYGIAKGDMAQRFNLKKDLGNEGYSKEFLEKNGFQTMSISQLFGESSKGRMSVEHPDSIFNKNIIIDLGNAVGEDNRYLAIPFSPVSLNKDLVVKNKPQTELNSLIKASNTLQDYYMGNYKGNLKEEQLIENVIRKRDSVIESIGEYHLLGKNGLLGEMNLRLTSSVAGVTSSSVILNPDETKFKEILKKSIDENKVDKRLLEKTEETWKKVLDNNNGDVYKTLVDLNDSALNKATYEGKSILQHYQEGRYLNFRLAGEEQFEKLGYFSDSYLKSYFGKKAYKEKGYATLRKEMKDILSTEGTMTLTMRTPTIMTNSIAPFMMYLDDSLTGSNKTKVSIAGQLAFNGDNDADAISSSVITFLYGKNGKHREDYLLAKKRGLINTNRWKDIKANYLTRAIGDNLFYQSKAYTNLIEETTQAINNGNFYAITGNNSIDNKIYAHFGKNSFKQTEEIKKNFELLEEITKEYNKAYGTDFKYIDSTDGNILDNVENLINNMDIQQSQKDKYKDAIRFDKYLGLTEIEGQSKVRKNAIGEVNNSLNKLRIISDMTVGVDHKRMNYLQNVAYEIEQEVISSKKGSLRYYVTKGEEFNTALKTLLNPEIKDFDKATDLMRQWINKNEGLKENLGKVLTRLKQADSTIDKDFTVDDMIDNFMQTTRAISHTRANEINAFMRLGTAKKVYGKSHLINALRGMEIIPSDINQDFKAKTLNVLFEAGELHSTEILQREYVSKSASNWLSKNTQVIKDNVERQTKQTLKETFANMSANFKKSLSEFSASKGLLATATLATAYMLTGYIGNNASQPNDLQAQQMQENQQQYSSLSDMQRNMTISNQNIPKGYVINIKGSGNPQTINRTKNIIGNSMANSLGTNVNINMQIMDSNGNINDRYLDELIANSIS